jgi:hypothetical protein
MSSLGKILLWVALVGALVAAGFGWMVIQSRTADAVTLKQTQQTVTAATQKAQAATKEAEDAKQQATDANNKLAQANSSIEDLKAKMATLQQQATDAAKAQADAESNLKVANDSLTQIKASLGDKTPEQYAADEKKAEADLAAAQAEQKIMSDQVQSLQKQVSDAQDQINRSKTGTMPPGISGKITFVDRTWNFVILNVGLTNGIVPNGELIVYRGRTFLGKVRITKADENDAVAEILPDLKGNIEIGDAVLN